ncbi:MAG: RNA methyltransferase [Oscillospiraceae bacterium]|nr:RNA methyltransferase [Oscillospiraceae bacterium]
MIERITSRKNPLLLHIKKLFSSRSYRQQHGEYAADGIKLLDEAIKWIPQDLRTVLVTPKVLPHGLPEHVRLVEIPEDIMAQISPMEAPQGAIFTCALPQEAQFKLPQRSIVLDGVQDPGNLGTILRTADAMDLQVILTPGCADAYNHKVVRSTMGAVFRTPPMYAMHEEIAARCAAGHIPLCVTALSERAMDIREADLSRAAMVIGSEGKGVGAYFLEHADMELIIPMSERCESLNAAVAAAIVMWEMRR